MSNSELIEVKTLFDKNKIQFRNEAPEIPSTTYGTFSVFKYPAKFIPQIIAYILKEYSYPHMKVFDPFAGYGTVGIVSRIFGYDYIMWDLNPLLNHIHKTAIQKRNYYKIDPLLKDLKFSKEEFLPDWSNLNYWFSEEFLHLVSKAWGYVRTLDEELKFIFEIPLLKVTRYFSNSDEKVHKLYNSKHSKNKIMNLKKDDWKTIFYKKIEREVFILQKKLRENSLLKPKDVNFKIDSGIDVLGKNLDEDVDILITSPPYLQAQEYIRSTKLELYWLGYKENYIKELSKKEIPYRTVEKINIQSRTFVEYRNKIVDRHLLKIYDNYFHGLLNIFTRLGEKVKRYMFIFVGPASIRSIAIPIDDIITEHLIEKGWKHEITLIDKIVSRSMFQSEINPASGLKDNRIKTEHLVVLKKH